MASNLYHTGLKRIMSRLTGAIDLEADDIRVMLVTSSYTPNKDHEFVSDVVAAELSGTGYTGGFGGSGRKALTTPLIGNDTTGDFAYFDADDVTWTAISAGTPAYAIVHKKGAADASSPLICCVDVVDLTTGGENYKITWAAPASGAIFKWAA